MDLNFEKMNRVDPRHHTRQQHQQSTDVRVYE